MSRRSSAGCSSGSFRGAKQTPGPAMQSIPATQTPRCVETTGGAFAV